MSASFSSPNLANLENFTHCYSWTQEAFEVDCRVMAENVSEASLKPMQSSSLSKHSLFSAWIKQRVWLRQVYKNQNLKSEDESAAPCWWWDNFSSGLTATIPIRQTGGVARDKNLSLDQEPVRVTHQQSIIRTITFAFLASPLPSPLLPLLSSVCTLKVYCRPAQARQGIFDLSPFNYNSATDFEPSKNQDNHNHIDHSLIIISIGIFG